MAVREHSSHAGKAPRAFFSHPPVTLYRFAAPHVHDFGMGMPASNGSCRPAMHGRARAGATIPAMKNQL